METIEMQYTELYDAIEEYMEGEYSTKALLFKERFGMITKRDIDIMKQRNDESSIRIEQNRNLIKKKVSEIKHRFSFSYPTLKGIKYCPANQIKADEK